ncbi:MAG: peptidylprolyl isomerase [Bacteroidales bacterium]|nr:peptidylprolyl isomerase [Bacteroidales bacterium]
MACGQVTKPESAKKTDQITESVVTPVEQPEEPPVQIPAASEQKLQKAVISTSFGDMIVILYDETPIHRDNFIKLVEEGYYNGTLFHRVIKDFMVQGGDPDSKNAPRDKPLGMGGPGYTLTAEFHPEFIHKKGALAAARQGDQMNPERRSSGSQFYIVQGKKITQAELNNIASRGGVFYTPEQIKIYEEIGGTPFLDQQYTVFGEVIEGLDVIDKIANAQTGNGNRPVNDLKMTIKLFNK